MSSHLNLLKMKLDKDERILEAAQLAVSYIENDASLRQKMEAFGFTPERLEVGKELLSVAVRNQQQKDVCYNIQWELRHQISEQLEAVQDQFDEHLRVARIALRKQPTVLNTLRIERIEPKGWPRVRQAAYFYQQMQKQKLSLQGYTVSPKELQRAAAETHGLLSLRQERIRQKGLAESSTEAKNRAFEALRQWVRECRNIARIALKDSPQLMEGFGVLVRSGV